ncbi:hypothetical protein H5410_023233 [Solanum commersonii]|uniref:Uncharacterized protein n=1 Tax=Solanum commersonii TaxID=4109 RepID=A0A9J5ZIZ9_SOLCO|nr:hypothetical protein H5410_023233 [Solanum commersonii]
MAHIDIGKWEKVTASRKIQASSGDILHPPKAGMHLAELDAELLKQNILLRQMTDRTIATIGSRNLKITKWIGGKRHGKYRVIKIIRHATYKKDDTIGMNGKQLQYIKLPPSLSQKLFEPSDALKVDVTQIWIFCNRENLGSKQLSESGKPRRNEVLITTQQTEKGRN